MFTPLGVNVHIGVSSELQGQLDIVDTVTLSDEEIARDATEAGRHDVLEQLKQYQESMKDVVKKDNPTAWAGMDNSFWNSESARRAEVTSRGGLASARGLAVIADSLAQTGNGIISRDTWLKMHQEAKEGVMLGGLRTFFTQGGVNCFVDGEDYSKGDINESVPKLWAQRIPRGMFGWNGYGGSVFVWDLERQLSFAYVPTYLAWYDKERRRAVKCLKALYGCLDARQ